MRALCSFLLLVLFTVKATTGQAPGDEDEVCLMDIVNEEVLMSSFYYRNLLINRSPWSVVDNDTNNGNPSVTTVNKIRYTELNQGIFILCFISVD